MAVVANAYAAWRILHANQTQFQLAPQFASSFQERFALSKEFIDDRLAAAQEAHSVDDGQLSRSSSSSPRHSQGACIHTRYSFSFAATSRGYRRVQARSTDRIRRRCRHR